MEYENNPEVLSVVKIEIKQEEDNWQEEGTATEPIHQIELNSDTFPSLLIKQETSEVNDVDEDPLSISPRLTSEHASQDDNDSCSILPHSDSGGHSQMAEVADTKPYKCDICEKSFKQKHNLEFHMQVHSYKEPYKCDFCEKSFKWKSSLERHFLFHSATRLHKCDICDKSFKQKSHLELHIQLHSDKRPYKCDRCDKSFKQRGHLNQHILLHTFTRPNKCNLCEKSFKRKSHLNRHTLSHLDIKP